jgi:DNA-binding transcriptional LysR family regulator
MELRDLRIFATVLDVHGVTRAAERLHLAQSAVSQAIKRLERELGIELLERRPDGVRPTEAGAVLGRHARIMINSAGRAQRDMAAFRGLEVGTVRMGMGPTSTPLVLVSLLRRLRTLRPGLRLEVEEGLPGVLADRMHLGYLDLQIQFLPITVPGFEAVEFGRLPMATIVAPDHPLAKRRRVKLGELADEEWISAPPGNPARAWLEEACATAGFRPTVTMELTTLAHIRSFVEAGLGIAMMPPRAVRPEVHMGTLRAIETIDPRPYVSLVYVIDPHEASTAVLFVCDVLEQQWRATRDASAMTVMP